MTTIRTARCRRSLLLACALLLTACASAPPTPAPPPAPPGAAASPTGPASTAGATTVPNVEPPPRPWLGLFSQIRAPSEVEPAFELSANGVQIFRCEPDKRDFRWAFRLPEAELRDGRGQVVARHGTGYSFEHVDGSRLLGTIVSYDSASSSDSVPWLLLQTRSYGQGEFEKVSYVQRINTVGGMPPAQCSADQVNRVLRVPFSANFVFYRPH